MFRIKFKKHIAGRKPGQIEITDNKTIVNKWLAHKAIELLPWEPPKKEEAADRKMEEPRETDLVSDRKMPDTPRAPRRRRRKKATEE